MLLYLSFYRILFEMSDLFFQSELKFETAIRQVDRKNAISEMDIFISMGLQLQSFFYQKIKYTI